MQLFEKIFLFVFIFKNIKCEFKSCANENANCNINEIMLSDSEITDSNTLVKNVIQYFDDLNHKYDKKISVISNDIDYIKKSLKTTGLSPSCPVSLQQTQDTETITETLSGLYDRLWIVIQRRQDGSVSFYRSWDHYKSGFGNPFREFFIGLDKVFYLTDGSPHELLIQFEDFKGNFKYALYDEFLVGNESERYQLKKLGNYTGNAGDYLRSHVGMYFSTKDRDNDASADSHCAIRFQGAWWYNNCLTSNLNGPFRTRYAINEIGITWGKYDEMQVKTVQMMIRSKPKLDNE